MCSILTAITKNVTPNSVYSVQHDEQAARPARELRQEVCSTTLIVLAHSLTNAHRSNYRFGKTLGAGTYGIVREADGPRGKCAVKIILKKNVRGNEQMVYDEMEMLQRMHHPHIVKFYEWFESKVRPYGLDKLTCCLTALLRTSTISSLSSQPVESFSIAYVRRANSQRKMLQRRSDRCSMP